MLCLDLWAGPLLFLPTLDSSPLGLMLAWPAVESFVETDRSYLSNDAGGGAGRDDGCTAVTAVLQGQKLIVANVGDSRAVLSRAGHGAHCCYLLSSCSDCLLARLWVSAGCPALAALPVQRSSAKG